MLELLADLLAEAPAIPQPFSGTEYSLPVQLALYGRALPTAEVAEKARSATTTVASLESALALAEAADLLRLGTLSGEPPPPADDRQMALFGEAPSSSEES